MSNRLILVDREFCHPTIEGVDFGGRCWVVARSPGAVLIWVMGHSSSVNGHRTYCEPCLYLLLNRSSSGNLEYKRVHSGNRMAQALIMEHREKLDAAFGEVMHPNIISAVMRRETLIIDGGGGKLMPSRLGLGAEAEYLRWRDMPAEERGFRTPAAAADRDRRSFGYEKFKENTGG